MARSSSMSVLRDGDAQMGEEADPQYRKEEKNEGETATRMLIGEVDVVHPVRTAAAAAATNDDPNDTEEDMVVNCENYHEDDDIDEAKHEQEEKEEQEAVEQRQEHEGEPEPADYYDLHCSICLDWFYEPITLHASCSHTFCRLCLLQSTKQAPDGRSCPQCRVVIQNIPDLMKHSVDETMVAKITATALVSPEEVQERAEHDQHQLQVLLQQLHCNIPIFIMRGAQAYRPGQRIKLHFFEPRYRILIRRAWEGKQQFLWIDQRPTIVSTPSNTNPIHGLLVQIETARFLPDGRATISGRGVERRTYQHCWIEDGTQGLWYASNTPNTITTPTTTNTIRRSNTPTVIPRGIGAPAPRTSNHHNGTYSNIAPTTTRSEVATITRYGNRDFPIFGYNGLSVVIPTTTAGTTSSFVFFEPRYLILAQECWTPTTVDTHNADRLFLCASTAVPVAGQTVVLARMLECVTVPSEGTTSSGTSNSHRRRITAIGLQKVQLRANTVREDRTKHGLWYAQINTLAPRRTPTTATRRLRRLVSGRHRNTTSNISNSNNNSISNSISRSNSSNRRSNRRNKNCVIS